MSLSVRDIPDLNTITLQEGMDRANYWREAVKHLYKEGENPLPRGFFISIEDIIELAKLATSYPEYQVIGVRAYLSFHQPQRDHPPYTDAITALLVPVQRKYLINDAGGEEGYTDKDLIIPADQDSGTVTIYDVTMPCPKVCDTDSYLY
jgi:hypothetical protein